MSGLAERLAQRIRRDGALPIETFWNVALFDRQAGYYTTAEPIGRDGDFTTAPEISQMFGELLAAWLLTAWRALGRPAPFAFVEIGPGRGTLMADMVRTLRRLDPAFLRAATIHLVEVSDRLAAEQQSRLGQFDLPIIRQRDVSDLPEMPMLLVANELFDAIAIRQFVFRDGQWLERRVGLDAAGALCRVDQPSAQPPSLPRHLAPPVEGDIIEQAPARAALARQIGQRLARDGGAALMVDYGHAFTSYGDTLQALRRHGFADPLAEPGRQDITSHVDFEALAGAFLGAGAHVAPLARQGDFLLALGLAQRAGVLGASLDAAGRAGIEADVGRLAGNGPAQMGSLFKVLAAASIPLPLPPFN